MSIAYFLMKSGTQDTLSAAYSMFLIDAQASSDEEQKQLIRFWHGLVLGVAWCGLGFVMMATSRWCQHKDPRRMLTIHMWCGWLLTAVTVAMVALILVRGFKIGALHTTSGWIVSISCIIMAILG